MSDTTTTWTSIQTAILINLLCARVVKPTFVEGLLCVSFPRDVMLLEIYLGCPEFARLETGGQLVNTMIQVEG